MNERKPISVPQLLRWTYAVQMADVATGRTLADPNPDREPTHFSSLDLPADGARRREAPAWRSGGAATATAHPDAVQVHDAVMALPPHYARLVIEFGRSGRFPEPCEVEARPMPFEPDIGTALTPETRKGRGARRRKGSIESWKLNGAGPPSLPPTRPGGGYWRGEWTQCCIAVAEVFAYSESVFVKAGRGRMKLSHHEKRTWRAEYCPVVFWPDADYVRACNRIADAWRDALDLFRGNLPSSGFINHLIASSTLLAGA